LAKRVAVLQDGANGVAALSVTEMSEIQQTVVKQSDSEVEVSQHRVFLLGENRWEEPRRLDGRNRQVSESKSGDTTTKCLACRGEGHVMCTGITCGIPLPMLSLLIPYIDDQTGA